MSLTAICQRFPATLPQQPLKAGDSVAAGTGYSSRKGSFAPVKTSRSLE